MMNLSIPGVSLFEFESKLYTIIVKYKSLNFFYSETFQTILVDLLSDILNRNLCAGTVSYTYLMIEFKRSHDTIVFTLDHFLKRQMSEPFQDRKKIKLTKQEKSDLEHGLEMLTQDSLKTKVVITRETIQQLSFMESMIMAMKDLFCKFKNK